MNATSFLLCLVLLLWVEACVSFQVGLSKSSLSRAVFRSSTHYVNKLPVRLSASNDNDGDDADGSLQDSAQELKRLRERAHHAEIVDDLFRNSNSRSNSLRHRHRPLMDLALTGKGTVGAWAQPNRSLGNQLPSNQKPILCVFLSTPQASDDVIATYLKRRYPTWEVPPDLKVRTTSSSSSSSSSSSRDVTVPAVPLPVPVTRETSKEIKLLSFAFRGRPISKNVFLPLAHLLTDRDGGLWDNLPWTEWTIDPQHKVPQSYQQTGAMGKKLMLGRRDAYNRMIGKDWYGRSLSIGNTAARMKYKLEDTFEREEDEKKERDESSSSSDNNNSMESNLAFRILQVQVQEASMELAEAEQKYALVKAKLDDFTSDEVVVAHYKEIQASVNAVEQAIQAKKAVEDALEQFQQAYSSSGENQHETTELESTVHEFLERIVQSRYNLANKGGNDNDDNKDTDATTWNEAAHKFVDSLRKQDNLMNDLQTILNRQISPQKWKNGVIDFLDGVIERETKNAPPYRGAMGYSPQVDTKEEMFQKATLPYRSPYDLLVEIIQEQFHAQVVGCVLENSSLFPGTLILEGAIVLRRKGRSKSLTIGGEVVELEDSEDNMGNTGVQMGDTLIVECSGAEAIGMALSCNLPVSVERKVWEEVVTDISLSKGVEALPENELESVMNTIPPVRQATNSANRVTVTEGGEALVGGGKKTTDTDDEVESVISLETKDIQSVADYDALSVPDKARMILSSGQFEEGRTLPRPRVLREFEETLNHFKQKREKSDSATIRTTLSPLDEILVPMLQEELVRLEIYRRDAYRRRDQLAIDSITRTIEEYNERHENKVKAKDDSTTTPSFLSTIQRDMDEHLLKEEINQTLKKEDDETKFLNKKDETEDQQEEEPSIFE